MSQPASKPKISTRFAIAIIACVVISPILTVVIAFTLIRQQHAATLPPPRAPSPAARVQLPPPDHPGAAAYAVCAACHGGEGEGNAALGGPALAGQEPWYLERQLHAFKAGIRGSHLEDIYGQQMRPMAETLADEQAVSAVAEYIAAFPPLAEPEGFAGNAAHGQSHFALCVACHGPQGGGIEALGGPSLRNQHGWYLERQLVSFKAGLRGAHPQDTYGQQMRPMAMVLPDEAAIQDVVAYILSLDQPSRRGGSR